MSGLRKVSPEDATEDTAQTYRMVRRAGVCASTVEAVVIIARSSQEAIVENLDSLAP